MEVMIFRTFIATIVGGIFGYLREKKAGYHVICALSITCMGACLIVASSEYQYIRFMAHAGDPARMAAQIVNGIGFLGAGMIIFTGSRQKRGLVTAATFWIVAILGITVGVGFYSGVICSILVYIFVNDFFVWIQKKAHAKARTIWVEVEGNTVGSIKRLVKFLEHHDHKVLMIQYNDQLLFHEEWCGVVLCIQLQKHIQHKEIVSQISEIRGIMNVVEV